MTSVPKSNNKSFIYNIFHFHSEIYFIGFRKLIFREKTWEFILFLFHDLDIKESMNKFIFSSILSSSTPVECKSCSLEQSKTGESGRIPLLRWKYLLWPAASHISAKPLLLYLQIRTSKKLLGF